MNNYWSEFEYSKLKLLLNYKKVESILDVYRGTGKYDPIFPISVEMHLTNACNLRCSWCTDKELMKKGASLSYEKVIELLDEFAVQGTGVTLEGGGEPTLHKNFSQIAGYAYANNINLGLITNGTVDISSDAYKFNWIRVSLDSSNQEEYKNEKGINKFNTVLDNLKKICSCRNPEKTYVGVGYVITTRNMHGLEQLIEKLDKTGVDYIYFRPVEEAEDILPTVQDMLDLKKNLISWTKDRRIQYLINIKDRIVKDNNSLPCVAHSLTSIIHADGTVNLCEKRRHDEICLGNINEMTFGSLWNSETRKLATNKLLCPDCQGGCDVCRITGFNEIFDKLAKLNTKKFI
mgnify:FL=1